MAATDHEQKKWMEEKHKRHENPEQTLTIVKKCEMRDERGEKTMLGLHNINFGFYNAVNAN